jgi:hypothetical protein
MTELQAVEKEQARLYDEIKTLEKNLSALVLLRKENEAIWLDLKQKEALSRVSDSDQVLNVRYYGRWDSEWKSKANPSPRKFLTKIVRVVWFKAGDALHSAMNLNVGGEVLGLTQHSYVQKCLVHSNPHGSGLGYMLANMIETAAPLRTEQVTVDSEPYFSALPSEVLAASL